MKYFLAINYGLEGWSLTPYESIEKLQDALMKGETHGNEFKIFKELKIEISE